MNLLEKDVVAQHKDFLELRGWRLVRTHPAVMPGSFSAGEPGEPDFMVVWYMGLPDAPWRTISWWLELKGPRDQRSCRCEVVATKRGSRKKICKICRQKNWQDRERERGAIVIQSSDIAIFARWYEVQFAWLHRDQVIKPAPPVRQMELL